MARSMECPPKLREVPLTVEQQAERHQRAMNTIARGKTDPLSFRPYKIIATIKGHPDIEQVEGLIRANRNNTTVIVDRETEVEFLLERETSARSAVLRALGVLELFVVKDVFVQAVNLAGR